MSVFVAACTLAAVMLVAILAPFWSLPFLVPAVVIGGALLGADALRGDGDD
jgi:hypothetical protein